MITIESKYDYPAALIERAVQAALTHQKESLDVNLSVVLTDNRRLHKLNRDYLGVDAPTDVLSFPASESDPETGARYIGDILISVPYAAKGAKLAGNSLEAELQLLVVEPHSMSTVPFCTRGMRFCEVTGWYLTSSFLPTAFSAAAMMRWQISTW